MARKSTKGELLMRREAVQELMLQGKTPTEISTIISEKYKIKKRLVVADMNEIAKSWAAKEDETRPLIRNKFLERLEHLFKIALEAGNLKNALEVQKEINKISGLYNEATSKEEPPKFITLKARDGLSVVPKASNDSTTE